MFLYDGQSTLISFAVAPAIFLREKEVQVPAYDMGGPIDTTTMRNTVMRTKAPKSLLDLGDMTIQANYDPAVLTTLLANMGVNGLITVTFPDAAVETFYGYIDKFTPAALKEGEFPLAEVKVVATNRVPVTGIESLPSGAGGIGSPGSGGTTPGTLLY